jgi:hypothetical protein
MRRGGQRKMRDELIGVLVFTKCDATDLDIRNLPQVVQAGFRVGDIHRLSCWSTDKDTDDFARVRRKLVKVLQRGDDGVSIEPLDMVVIAQTTDDESHAEKDWRRNGVEQTNKTA